MGARKEGLDASLVNEELVRVSQDFVYRMKVLGLDTFRFRITFSACSELFATKSSPVGLSRSWIKSSSLFIVPFPRNRTFPRNSSARMQPADKMSTDC